MDFRKRTHTRFTVTMAVQGVSMEKKGCLISGRDRRMEETTILIEYDDFWMDMQLLLMRIAKK